MENLWRSLFYYFAAYFIVTLIGVFHTIFNIYVLHYKSMKDSPGMGDAYEKTKPFHPLYNLIIFPVFAGLFLNTLSSLDLGTVIFTSLLWGTLTIIIDVFGWVIIKHPWSLSFKEFYIDYQPWITLTYLVIYASPFLAFGIICVAAW